MDVAVDELFETGNPKAFQTVAEQIALDISAACNRIKTRQLRNSFRGKADGS